MFDRKPDVEKLLKKKHIKGLAKALKHKSALIRRHAAEALGELGDPRSVEPLTQALEDGVLAVAAAAAEALGRTQSQDAVLPLISVVITPVVSEELRRAASNALGNLGDMVVEPLVRTLKLQDKRVRLSAVEALGKIKSREVLIPLIEALEDSYDQVRKTAATILGEIGDPIAFEHLVKALEDEDGEVFSAAAEALEKLEDSWRVEPFVLTIFSDEPLARSFAGEALGKIGDRQTTVALITSLKDKGVNAKIIESLGKLGDPRAIEMLSTYITHPSWHIRFKTVEALSKIGGADVVKPLATALNDGETGRGIFTIATEGLGKSSSSEAVSHLIDAMRVNEDAERRQCVAAALTELYQSGNLSDGAKTRIIKLKQQLDKKHTDQTEEAHQDSGIRLEIDLPED